MTVVFNRVGLVGREGAKGLGRLPFDGLRVGRQAADTPEAPDPRRRDIVRWLCVKAAGGAPKENQSLRRYNVQSLKYTFTKSDNLRNSAFLASPQAWQIPM